MSTLFEICAKSIDREIDAALCRLERIVFSYMSAIDRKEKTAEDENEIVVCFRLVKKDLHFLLNAFEYQCGPSSPADYEFVEDIYRDVSKNGIRYELIIRWLADHFMEKELEEQYSWVEGQYM